MKIIVDTSIWSLALRRQSEIVNQEAVLLKTLIEEGNDIYLLGIILQEILQGIRTPKHFYSLTEYFRNFPFIEPRREDYIKAAELKNNLIKKGKQVSTIDALIASIAISYDCFLFTADRDFAHIAGHSKLKLFK
jgi:predicted nucleic acid-binding protein